MKVPKHVVGLHALHAHARAAAGVLLLLGATACNWFDDPSPDEARLMIDGPAGTTVQLVTSTSFVAARRTDGVTEVEIIDSETISATLPFESTYGIRDEQRFLAWTSQLDSDVENIRVRVFLDGTKEFDQSGPLQEGTDYRFVYAFNQPVSQLIELTF